MKLLSPWLALALVFTSAACNPLGGGSQAGATFQPGVQASLTLSTISVSQSEIAAGDVAEVVLALRDQNGQPLVVPGFGVDFVQQNGSSTLVFDAVRELGGGLYAASFEGLVAGTPTEIGARINGIPLEGVSPSVQVVPGEVSLATSTFVASPSMVSVGAVSNLTLIARDSRSNPVGRSVGTVTMARETAAAQGVGTLTSVTDLGNGTYTAQYTAVTKGLPNILRSVLVGSGAFTNTASVSIGNSVPTLTSVANLLGALEDVPYSITHAAMLAASNAADPDGDPLSFVVEEVLAGTLSKNGSPVVEGVTLLSPGDTLVWTGDAELSGTFGAFTVRVSDGSDVSSTPRTLSIVVMPVNDVPTMSVLAPATINEDATLDVDFVIGDVETILECSSLRLSMGSSVPALLPTANVVWSGTLPDCHAVVTPAANQHGVTNVTFTVSDGVDTASRSFALTVNRLVDDPFDISWPFDAFSENLYAFFNTAKIQLSGGVARLTLQSHVDELAADFQAGEGMGADWSTDAVKLASVSCDGTATNCSKLDSSWAPRWSNIVAYWAFDETSADSLPAGADFADSSPLGALPATIVTGTTLGASGQIRRAISFSGAGYAITPASADLLQGSHNYTLAAWVRPGATQATYADIFDYGHCSQSNFAVQQSGTSTNVFGMGYRMANGNWATETVLPALKTNAWSQIVFVKEGAVIKGYLNGQLVATGPTNTTHLILKSSQQIVLGSNIICGGRTYNGSIDELAIWNAALNPQEIEAIYGRQEPRYAGTFTSRVFSPGGDVDWNSLGWKTSIPAGKRLPSSPDGSPGLVSEIRDDYPALENDTLMTGIQGLWHLNETAATAGAANDFRDRSGRQRHGEANGTIAYGTPGRLGRAVSLNGTNAYISGSIAGSTVFAGDFTVSAWINHRAMTAWGAIFSNAVGVNDAVLLTMRNSTTQIGINRVGVSEAGVYVDLGADHYGKWIFVTLRRSGSTLYVDAYKDGVKISSSAPLSWAIAGSGGYYIGRHYQSESQIFNGLIDEVAVWSRFVSNAEVEQLYLRGASRLKLQVRSCDQVDCSGVGWQGHDGSANTYFTEENNNTAPVDASGLALPYLPNFNFAGFGLNLSAKKFFQYRAVLESEMSGYPRLLRTNIGPSHYDASGPWIGNAVPLDLGSFGSFTLPSEAGCAGGGVRFTLSTNGSDWHWWNGSAWLASNNTWDEATAADQIDLHRAGFLPAAGTGNLRYRAFLKSNGSAPCELNEVRVTGDR